MRGATALSATLPVLALVFVVGAPTNTATALQNASNRISVDDPRSLASAVEALERRHGWIITYEDPPYEFAADVIDVSRIARKDLDPSKPRVLVPRG